MAEPAKGIVEQHGGWDPLYKAVKPAELPWNAGGPDSDLARLVQDSRLPQGRALDAGTGPGHDAAHLALNGWQVLAVDLSSTALALAAKTIREAYAEGRVTLREADILSLREPAESFALVHDRGCFHTLPAEAWPRYVSLIARLLGPGGKVVLRTFSDKEPAGPGPHRFSKKELQDLWAADFVFEEFRDGIFEGPRKPKAWFALLRKKG